MHRPNVCLEISLLDLGTHCRYWQAVRTGGITFISLSSFWLSRRAVGLKPFHLLHCQTPLFYSLAVPRLTVAIIYFLWVHRVLSTHPQYPNGGVRIKHLNIVFKASGRLLKDQCLAFISPLAGKGGVGWRERPYLSIESSQMNKAFMRLLCFWIFSGLLREAVEVLLSSLLFLDSQNSESFYREREEKGEEPSTTYQASDVMPILS